MSAISNNDIAGAIFLVLKDKSKEEQQAFLPKIINFLYKRRLLSRAKDILLRLGKIMNRENETLEANLWSALPLKENSKVDIAKFLKQRHGAKRIIFNEKLDEKLLGGFKIEVEDEVIDLTTNNKIKKLQEYLTKSV
jgi:ATP synthase F1 delta subunit